LARLAPTNNGCKKYCLALHFVRHSKFFNSKRFQNIIFMKRESYFYKTMEAGNESEKQRQVLRYYAVLWIRTRSDPKLFFGHVGAAYRISI